MKTLNILTIIAIAMLLFACGGNKSEAPYTPPPPVKTPFEIAAEKTNQAKTSYEDEDFDKALSLFKEALSIYETNKETALPSDSIPQIIFRLKLSIAKVHFDYAVQYREQKIYDKAIDELEAAIETYRNVKPEASPSDDIDGKLFILYKYTADTYQKAAQPLKAIEYYDLCINLNPQDYDILLQKFKIYKEDLKNEQQALTVMALYADKTKDYNNTLWLAEHYYGKSDFNNALVWYQKAFAIKPEDNVMLKIANTYRQMTPKQYSNSNSILEAFLAKNPTDKANLKLAYKYLGDNYQNLNNKAKSIEFFEKYLSLEDDAQIAIAVCQYYILDKKDYRKALFYANKALTINPNYSAAIYYRGISKYNLKDIAGAKADFEKLKNDPKYKDKIKSYLQ